MIIKIKAMTGKLYEFDTESADKAYALKQKLSEKIGIAVEQLKLVYNGVPLKDTETVGEKNIKPGSVIQAALVLKGGE
jgi:hypothetical protein